MTVKSLFRGNARLSQNGISAGGKIAMLEKEPGGGPELLARVLYAFILFLFHRRSLINNRTV